MTINDMIYTIGTHVHDWRATDAGGLEAKYNLLDYLSSCLARRTRTARQGVTQISAYKLHTYRAYYRIHILIHTHTRAGPSPLPAASFRVSPLSCRLPFKITRPNLFFQPPPPPLEEQQHSTGTYPPTTSNNAIHHHRRSHSRRRQEPQGKVDRTAQTKRTYPNHQGYTSEGSIASRHRARRIPINAAETENVRPPASTKTEASDVDKATENVDREPLSPLPAGATLLTQIPLGLKDARAYEHERQQAKRAAERAAHHRAKKAGALHHQADAQAGRRTRTRRGVDPVEVDAGLSPIDRASSPVRATLLIEGLNASFSSPTLSPKPLLSPTPTWSESNRPIELDLASLLNSAKFGAGRKVRGDRDGFEFVPPVRSVIALDDESFSNSGEVEEGWEHIEREDGGRRGAVSYAQVAALRAGE